MGSFIAKLIVALCLVFTFSLAVFQPVWSMGKVKKVFNKSGLSSQDKKYLKEIAKETWDSIDYMVNKETQLPYDNIRRHEWTSVTNIGLYVASVVAAVELGFLPRKAAVERLDLLLTNLGHFSKWEGFTQSWNSVLNGRPAPHDSWLSTLDSGNLYAGLMVGRGYFPELKKQFTEIIDQPKWESVYDEAQDKLLFGYNFKTKQLGGPLNDFGSDARLAYILAIAKGVAHVDSLQSLNRTLEERYGLQYYYPGWQGGGVFMQLISGLILDERDTMMGQAAANFVYAQIIHAKENNYPFWGWSACEEPEGTYLGMKALIDEVVTPHASVLAINYYPRHVVSNLKKLERLGARKPFVKDGKEYKFGFRDSINFKTLKTTKNYLLLDQCMLFLSLGNFLEGGIIWKSFKKNTGIKETYKKVEDLKKRKTYKKLKKRDLKTKPELDDLKTVAEKKIRIRRFVEKGMKEGNAIFTSAGVKLDGELSDWKKAKAIVINRQEHAEIESGEQDKNQQAVVYYMWDQEYLYFAAKVWDQEFVFNEKAADLWKDDAIELFISPKQNDFSWGRKDCFQIGLSAGGPDKKPQKWAWFQEGDPGNNVKIASSMDGSQFDEDEQGYIIEAAIKWSFLGIEPKADTYIGTSPAIHFVDEERENDVKLNWCYLPDGKSLGKLFLKK